MQCFLNLINWLSGFDPSFRTKGSVKTWNTCNWWNQILLKVHALSCRKGSRIYHRRGLPQIKWSIVSQNYMICLCIVFICITCVILIGFVTENWSPKRNQTIDTLPLIIVVIVFGCESASVVIIDDVVVGVVVISVFCGELCVDELERKTKRTTVTVITTPSKKATTTATRSFTYNPRFLGCCCLKVEYIYIFVTVDGKLKMKNWLLVRIWCYCNRSL